MKTKLSDKLASEFFFVSLAMLAYLGNIKKTLANDKTEKWRYDTPPTGLPTDNITTALHVAHYILFFPFAFGVLIYCIRFLFRINHWDISRFKRLFKAGKISLLFALLGYGVISATIPRTFDGYVENLIPIMIFLFILLTLMTIVTVLFRCLRRLLGKNKTSLNNKN